MQKVKLKVKETPFGACWIFLINNYSQPWIWPSASSAIWSEKKSRNQKRERSRNVMSSQGYIVTNAFVAKHMLQQTSNKPVMDGLTCVFRSSYLMLQLYERILNWKLELYVRQRLRKLSGLATECKYRLRLKFIGFLWPSNWPIASCVVKENNA